MNANQSVTIDLVEFRELVWSIMNELVDSYGGKIDVRGDLMWWATKPFDLDHGPGEATLASITEALDQMRATRAESVFYPSVLLWLSQILRAIGER